MKTLDQFVSDWTGKGIDYDGSFGFQCQDLYRTYVKEVLGFPQSPAVPGAKDNWDKYLPAYFDRIPNSPTGVPVKGDIMIWGASYGPYGHVAVVTEATVNTFKCFSQNDPTGSLPAIRWYKNYTGTLGWLHPKGATTSDNTDLQKQIGNLTKEVSDKNEQITNYVTQVQGWEKKYEECNAQRIEAGASADGFRKQLNDFVAKLAQILGTRQETVEIIASVETAITFEDKASQLDRQIELERKEHSYAVEVLEKKIKSLESNLESLKAEFKILKDTQITPTKPTAKFSILELLKKLFGG